MDQAFSSSLSLSWPNDLGPGPGTPTPLDPDIVSLAGNSFELTLVPQELLQMPMTFEWDWPDVNSQFLWDAENPIFNGV